MRFVDASEFSKMSHALELASFQGIVNKHIDSTKERLQKR